MPDPDCPVCKDAGWLKDDSGLFRCGCKREEDAARQREVLWRISDLPTKLQTASLSAFDVTHSGNKAARDAVAAFLAGTLGTPWLTLVGGLETGKSHLAACVVRGTVEQGHYALYRYVPKLLQRLRNAMSDNYAEEYAKLERPDVLVLDDFGAEEWSPWAVETLTILIEDYYEEEKRLLITTNLDLTQWPERLARIRRRIEDPDRCTVVVNDALRFKGGKG